MGMRQTRSELLLAVVEHVRRTGDTVAWWGDVPGLADEFGSADNVLRALHRRWHVRLLARLDALLEDPPAEMPRAVTTAWEKLAAENPAWRALLHAYRGHPALRDAEARQRRLLDLAYVSAAPGAGTAPRTEPPPGDPPRAAPRRAPVRR